MLEWLRSWRKTRGPAETAPLEIVFYTRAGCHLCDEAFAILQTYEAHGEVRIEIRDVDARPDWQAAYAERVPVLEVGGRPRLWGQINEVLLRRLIRKR